MNRRDLQALANLRIYEAQALYRARQYSGAYYLAGYAVECALKACIARRVRRYDFPDKRIAFESHTHDLQKLATIAGIRTELQTVAAEDPALARNWTTTQSWSEESRYRVIPRMDCRTLLDAIMNEEHGVLPWIIQRW
ncbi:DNA-binding protein [Silvibacterium sp.]|uniref:DNA-binding protein n=1 Tax=Silvibacterium sp. TaxID=1964179 RepID=UPI0039E57FB2